MDGVCVSVERQKAQAMHEFENFKGFAKAQIELLRPLTILIGPNGSGKSNAIEAVELLSFVARGGSLHDVSDIGKNPLGVQIRGGLQGCPRTGHEDFSLAFTANARFESKSVSFCYSIAIKTAPNPRIARERLSLKDVAIPIFDADSASSTSVSGDMTVSYNNFARGGNKPQVLVTAQCSALSQYKRFAQRHEKYGVCVAFIDIIEKHLRASFVFDPVPRLMRGYERIGSNDLARDGSNLSAVLYGISQNQNEGKETLQRLQDYVAQLPEEPFVGFGFVTTSLNDVIFGLKLKDQEKLVDARMLSDGTLRSLAVLTAIETVAVGSRVVIEEFDNGVHPSRVQVLTRALADCCRRRKLNVLVTTHNPATMDLLDQDQLNGVVFCVWDKSQGAFRLVRLKDLPGIVEFMEQGHLGDLVTRRVVEKHLVPNYEGEQKRKALAWLEALP